MTLHDDLRRALIRDHDAIHGEPGVCDCMPGCAYCRIIIVGDLRAMRDRLKESIQEAGGCDHSVGICACTDLGLIEQADVELGDAEWCSHDDEGELSCGRCYGSGIYYINTRG